MSVLRRSARSNALDDARDSQLMHEATDGRRLADAEVTANLERMAFAEELGDELGAAEARERVDEGEERGEERDGGDLEDRMLAEAGAAADVRGPPDVGFAEQRTVEAADSACSGQRSR